MEADSLEFSREEADGRGGVYVTLAGERLGEQTYRRVDEHHVVIDHTAVDKKLQGKGVARRLLDENVAWARKTGTRISATCTYAKAQFEKDASIRDVYDP